MTENRRHTRDSLFLLATMRLADQAETLRIKVRNLSPSGMMAECAVHVERGERLLVDLRNVGWVGGTVTWVMESRFGVTFDRDIACRTVRRRVIPGNDRTIKYPLAKAQALAGNLRRI